MSMFRDSTKLVFIMVSLLAASESLAADAVYYVVADIGDGGGRDRYRNSVRHRPGEGLKSEWRILPDEISKIGFLDLLQKVGPNCVVRDTEVSPRFASEYVRGVKYGGKDLHLCAFSLGLDQGVNGDDDLSDGGRIKGEGFFLYDPNDRIVLAGFASFMGRPSMQIWPNDADRRRMSYDAEVAWSVAP